jgi:acid phosphatase
MPEIISNADFMYIRATPIPRALESVQQTFLGMYPKTARTADFPPPTIITRSPGEETLFPNDSVCRRFAQISREYAQRAADRWNDSTELAYVQGKIGKWMPNEKKVAVDSHPRLSGIMDTINATMGHGSATRLPQEFYDPDLIKFIERIGVEEWFQGYNESQEYRKLGIGGLVADIVARMAGNAERNEQFGMEEVGGEDPNHGIGRGGEKRVKFGLSGCHDTTLAGVLSSLGCYNMEAWPPYTSHIAIELFKEKGTETPSPAPPKPRSKFLTWFGGQWPTQNTIGRTPLSDLSDSQKTKLDGYFVRVRYNDEVMKIPGCTPPGKHLEGDESLCTLVCYVLTRIATLLKLTFAGGVQRYSR